MKAGFVGVDFGLSVTDAVLVQGGRTTSHVSLHRPGPADAELLARVLSSLRSRPDVGAPAAIGVSGGRSAQLPPAFEGVAVVHAREPEAIGRGGLALSGVERALVVSCGTGTAMINADATAQSFQHVSGTAVGGGTLEGLGMHLLGLRDASAIAELALSGDAGGVDTTLGEVLGSGVGRLPPAATAVNLARLADIETPAPADLAAGLVTMVAQTIALIALNSARTHGLEDVVFLGRLAEFEAVRRNLEAVFTLYGAGSPRFPEGAALATALGAALSADAVASGSVAG